MSSSTRRKSPASSHGTSAARSIRSSRSFANSKYSNDHIKFSQASDYRSMGTENASELKSLHSADNHVRNVKRWVSPDIIKRIILNLQEAVDQIELQKKDQLELSRKLRILQHITSYNNSGKITLPELYNKFWENWESFKNSAMFVTQPEGLAAYIKSQLMKASDYLVESEDSMEEGSYDAGTFDYVFGKLDAIYISLKGYPDMHSCKRVYTVASQDPDLLFTDQDLYSSFLRCIRHCIKAIMSVENSPAALLHQKINEAELALKDLVPEKLLTMERSKKRGKSVSNVCSKSGNKKRGNLNQYPSFAKQTNLRSLNINSGFQKRSATPPARLPATKISLTKNGFADYVRNVTNAPPNTSPNISSRRRHTP